jgi:hypothetical protein
MGVVYLARQRNLDRSVALKMVLSQAQASGEDLLRFRSEAEAVARLQHPNVVQIYEVGDHEGLPFLSLEYVGGGNLAARLLSAPLPPTDAARLLVAIARGVDAAHRQGVVHRDLKPANVLLTTDGTPKIADFGLAKKVDVNDGRTVTGMVMGTPSYMAPEQAAGRNREVGPPADVYALGAILYEMITGRPPFRGATAAETLAQVTSHDLVSPSRLQPKVPRDLETICLKCLEKDPARRYPTAAELVDDLDRFLAGDPVRARPVPTWEKVKRWAERRPARAFIAVLGLAAVLRIGVNVWWSYTTLEAVQAEAHKARAQASARGEELRETTHELTELCVRHGDVAMLDRITDRRLAQAGTGGEAFFDLARAFARLGQREGASKEQVEHCTDRAAALLAKAFAAGLTERQVADELDHDPIWQAVKGRKE